MKKFLKVCFMLAIAGIIAVGCHSCHSNKNVKQDYDGVAVSFNDGVDHIIALHKQTMFNLYKGKQYAWYETRVLFNDSIKWANIDDLKVIDVTDIFQTFDPARCQYISTNVEKGTIIPPAIPDIWIEDCDMSNSPVKLMPNDVLEKLKAWDGILPPAVGMTLRQPLGPRICNPQWVIGNMMQVIFVDAVTGDITNWCPAFPIPNVAGPLGEWP